MEERAPASGRPDGPLGKKRYRVAQWATGNIGMRALRAIIEHPQLDLVGLYVYSDAKAGKDAGELCGVGPTGVIATKDIEEILAADPDCVVYMPEPMNVDDVCRLLESGANIVTSVLDLHDPASLDPEVRARIEKACQTGGTSLHATGASPGFITEALPITLLSLQRRLDRYVIDEFADMSSRNSPELIFEMLGFGREVSTFDVSGLTMFGAMTFGPSLRQLAAGIGAPLDDVTAVATVAGAAHDVDIAAGHLEAGTVAAQRIEVTGLRNGRPLLVFRANWYLTRDLDVAWDLRESGWHVRVEGDTPLDVSITFPVPEEDYAATSPGLTAHRPVNAVPYVVEAEPGIRLTTDLPQIIANLGS